MGALTPDLINVMFPVVGIEVYPGGVIVKRSCNPDFQAIKYSHLRGVIAVVNKRSLNRLALLVRSCGVEFKSVITATYGLNFPHSGRIAKAHLNHLIVSLKRRFGPFEYVWIIEFQDRGAPHYHLVTTLPPPTVAERHEFALLWGSISIPGDWMYCQLKEHEGQYVRGKMLGLKMAGYAVHTHKKAWEKLRKRGGAGRYLAKYANKLRQKDVPDFYTNIGRFWGKSKGVKMPEPKYYHGTDDQVRELAATYGRNIQGWKVLPKVILLG